MLSCQHNSFYLSWRWSSIGSNLGCCNLRRSGGVIFSRTSDVNCIDLSGSVDLPWATFSNRSYHMWHWFIFLHGSSTLGIAGKGKQTSSTDQLESQLGNTRTLGPLTSMTIWGVSVMAAPWADTPGTSRHYLHWQRQTCNTRSPQNYIKVQFSMNMGIGIWPFEIKSNT